MSIFMKSDMEMVMREARCYADCLIRATMHIQNNEFAEAATQFENVTRSLRELERLKQKKIRHDDLVSLVRSADINRLRSFYE